MLDLLPSVVDAMVDRGVRHVVYLVHSRLETVQAAVAHIKMCQGWVGRGGGGWARGGLGICCRGQLPCGRPGVVLCLPAGQV